MVIKLFSFKTKMLEKGSQKMLTEPMMKKAGNMLRLSKRILPVKKKQTVLYADANGLEPRFKSSKFEIGKFFKSNFPSCYFLQKSKNNQYKH